MFTYRSRRPTALALSFGFVAWHAGPARASELPDTVEIVGVVRDFMPHDESHGHPDFGDVPANGLGRYSGNIAETLGEDRRPMFTGGGAKVTQQWRDNQNRQICHCVYDQTLGDVQGQWGQPGAGGIESSESFYAWYHDVPVVNLSTPLTLMLVKQPDDTYLFDDEIDPQYSDLGGFFPIDDMLFGNGGGGGQNHNYLFTFELHTSFEYTPGQFFKFTGDDDVFVFINNQLVIDLGGVHAAHDQWIDLDRESLGLVEGETYPLDFFFAERKSPDSNFAIWTNILLETNIVQSVSAAWD